jgi:hypothetical protein
MLIEVLAVLSASAAAGMRLGLTLLLVGYIQDNLWEEIPILSNFPHPLLFGILIVWSFIELLGTKNLWGQRVIQLVQLIGSPFVGGLMAIAVLKGMDSTFQPVWLLAGVGGLFALVLKLVQIGWFFRLRRLPLWFAFGEDILCVILVEYAFKAPTNGGLIAIFLLWLAVRSSTEWYRWQQQRQREKHYRREG